MLVGAVPTAHFGQLADAIQDGHASVKIFTTDIIPGMGSQLMMPHGHIWEALKVVAAQGGIACIHAEDNDIVMFMYEKLMRENRVNFEHLAEVHNTLSEELSFNRVIRLAENVEGAALTWCTSRRRPAWRRSSRHGPAAFPMYGETLHQYLMYNAEDYKRPGGQMYHTYPSLKYPEDQKRLWEATNRGAIQAIATDELCCPLRAKLQGSRIDDVTGGNAGVEPRVGLMYTQMVTKRGYSPAHFVDMISSNAAANPGTLSAQGRLGGRLRRRHRAAADGHREDDPGGRPARDRLHALGRARGDSVADRHHPARQGGCAERCFPWRSARRAVPEAQGRRRHTQSARSVGRIPTARRFWLQLALAMTGLRIDYRARIVDHRVSAFRVSASRGDPRLFVRRLRRFATCFCGVTLRENSSNGGVG
jgi:hypothetical protein